MPAECSLRLRSPPSWSRARPAPPGEWPAPGKQTRQTKEKDKRGVEVDFVAASPSSITQTRESLQIKEPLQGNYLQQLLVGCHRSEIFLLLGRGHRLDHLVSGLPLPADVLLNGPDCLLPPASQEEC